MNEITAKLKIDTSDVDASLERLATRIAELKEQANLLRGVSAEIDAVVDDVIEGLERMEIKGR